MNEHSNDLGMLTNGRPACPGSHSQGLAEAGFEPGVAGWKPPTIYNGGRRGTG